MTTKKAQLHYPPQGNNPIPGKGIRTRKAVLPLRSVDNFSIAIVCPREYYINLAWQNISQFDSFENPWSNEFYAV